jgi:hypothetical protein
MFQIRSLLGEDKGERFLIAGGHVDDADGPARMLNGHWKGARMAPEA